MDRKSTGFFSYDYICSMQASDDLQTRWWKLEEKMIERFGKKTRYGNDPLFDRYPGIREYPVEVYKGAKAGSHARCRLFITFSKRVL